MNATTALATLLNLPLQRLQDAPHEPGLYVLADHEGRHRYIGSTAGKTFHDRIYRRHATGSENTSHKFSWAYNVGRMWRDRDEPDADGREAKALRTAFVRAYCRATWLPLSKERPELETLERAVINAAPAGVTAWNDRRGAVSPMREPTSLVDALIDSLGLSPERRAALDRQAARFALLAH